MNRLVEQKNKKLEEQKNKKLEEQKKQRARKARLVLTMLGLGLFGFISFFYAAKEMTHMMISYKIPLLLGGLFGLIVTLFMVKDRDLYFVAIICFGSLFVAVPLLINDVFANPKIETMKQMINVKNHSYRRWGPSVEIRYNDLEKKINIDNDDEQKIDSASYIILKVNKGFLGYYIIRHYQLVKD